LLSDLPPLFDELFQRLTAIAQALAFLELINESDRLARQIGDELMPPLGYEPATISTVWISQEIDVRPHETSASKPLLANKVTG
jgi:hypothetical protein